jgi:hypothetical protein
MDLYDIFLRMDGIKNNIISYLCKYDDNIYIFRMLNQSFLKLPIYNKLMIENQSKTYILNFLKTNDIKKSYISSFNEYIYVDPNRDGTVYPWYKK